MKLLSQQQHSKELIATGFACAILMQSTLMPHALAVQPLPQERPQQKRGPKSKQAVTAPWLVHIAKRDDWTLRLNKRKQRLMLSAGDPDQMKEEAVLARLMPAVPENYETFVSASMLAMKAKQFDDGLYAAVALAAQNGHGKLRSKKQLVSWLASQLNQQPALDSNAQSIVLSAAKLGGSAIKPNSSLEPEVSKELQSFALSQEQSKPVGFYTWSPQLSDLYKQDRMLQTKLTGANGISSVSRILRANPQQNEVYASQLKLVRKICNPFRAKDLQPFVAGTAVPDPKAETICVFPPCASHEQTLVEKMFSNKPIPPGFKLIDELVTQVQDGKISLKPKPASGWYDYQAWALEPLLSPEKTTEATKLSFSTGYRKQLVELFKSLMALTRETQVLHVGCGGGCADDRYLIYVKPQCTVEPLCTYYHRRAVSYGFILKVLQDSFGAEALNNLHRLREHGSSPEGLAEEIKHMEALFSGAYVQAAREIGLEPTQIRELNGSAIPESSVSYFKNWAKVAPKDPDLMVDARMMVPVFYDPQKKLTKVWVFMGWQQNYLNIEYEVPPSVMSLTCSNPKAAHNKPIVEFLNGGGEVYYPYAKEIYTDKILNRKEFQELCESNNNDPMKILAALDKEEKVNSANSPKHRQRGASENNKEVATPSTGE